MMRGYIEDYCYVIDDDGDDAIKMKDMYTY